MAKLPRVLLIENSPFLRYAFGRLLRLKGFEVHEATDGAEALESLADYPADLVLTNLNVPDMAGGELIVRIRSNPVTAGVPVVAITSNAAEEAETARRVGADHVLPRPIDLPGLLQRLRTLVPAAAL